MQCNLPCLTCPSSYYPDWCLSCDTSSVSFTNKSPMCWEAPMLLPQLNITCLFPALLLFPLLRKRSLTLIHILSNMQIVSYFKFLMGQDYTRVNYLYVGMRASVPWSQGWQLFSISGDVAMTGLGSMEETALNKLIRIISTWGFVFLALVVVGIAKIYCTSGVAASKFFLKNIGNAWMIAFYFTIQDISFFCLQMFFSLPFSSPVGWVLFVCAILLVLILLGSILLMFSFINPQSPAILHTYQHMFSLSMDYDIFMTYELPNLPQKQKKVKKYSNLRLMEIGWKIGYAALMVSFIFNTPGEGTQMIWSTLGYVLVAMIGWYITMPYDYKTEFIQFSIAVVSDAIVLTVLSLPLVFSHSNYLAFPHLLLVCALPALALISAGIEFFHPLYEIYPYDLYETGMKVIVQDKALKLELEKRMKKILEDQKRMKQINQENERLKEEMRLERERNAKEAQVRQKKKEEITSQRLANPNKIKVEELEKASELFPSANYIYPQQTSHNGSQDEDDFNKYRIDAKKRRKMYAFDKKKPFRYSNKVEE